MSSEFQPAPMPTGVVDIHGTPHMRDGTGAFRDVASIAPLKKLMDEMVRREFGFALALSDQLRRFRQHLMRNLDAFDELVAQEYKVRIGGEKGNRTYSSYDGLWQIKVKVQDRVAYGPELQAAKALFDECLTEWAADTRAEMRSIVVNAFNTDHEGQIARGNIHALLATESEDGRWLRGQQAIRDAVYVIGAKEYVQFRFRETHKQEFDTRTINLANA